MSSFSFVRPKLSLTNEGAKAIAAAAISEAASNGWNICVAILDEGGNLMYLEKMDGCQIGSVQICQSKAECAYNFKRPSKAISEMVKSGNVAMMSLPGCTPVEGGLPLLKDGQVIGAIGISGVTSVEDGIVAAAGALALESS